MLTNSSSRTLSKDPQVHLLKKTHRVWPVVLVYTNIIKENMSNIGSSKGREP